MDLTGQSHKIFPIVVNNSWSFPWSHQVALPHLPFVSPPWFGTGVSVVYLSLGCVFLLWLRSKTLASACGLWILAPSLLSYVTLGMCFNLSVSQLPYIYNKKNNTFLTLMFRRLNELICVKHLKSAWYALSANQSFASLSWGQKTSFNQCLQSQEAGLMTGT